MKSLETAFRSFLKFSLIYCEMYPVEAYISVFVFFFFKCIYRPGQPLLTAGLGSVAIWMRHEYSVTETHRPSSQHQASTNGSVCVDLPFYSLN